MNVKFAPPHEQAVLKRIAEAVREQMPEARAVLYGSRARGDAGPDSDWDLLVVTPVPVDEARKGALQERLFAIFAETDALVSPLWVDEAEWQSPLSRVMPFHQNVERDGIQLAGPPEVKTPLTEEAMAEARKELVQQWLGEAWAAWGDADYLAQGERWNACVNRLYYSCFHAVSALLLACGYDFGKHASVHGLFNRVFGPTDAVPSDLITLYNQLFKGRLEADYNPRVHYQATEVKPWLDLTPHFIETIEALAEAALRTGGGELAEGA